MNALPCECGAVLRERQNFCGVCGRANVYNPALEVVYHLDAAGKLSRSGVLLVNDGAAYLDNELRVSSFERPPR